MSPTISSTKFFLITLLFTGECIRHYLSSQLIQEFCIVPTNETTLDDFDNEVNNCSTFTFQQILQNYSTFFISNTKLHLLPGTHKVTESFGRLNVRDLHNFIMAGTTCSSFDFNNTNCSEIQCTGNGMVGIAFTNSTNIEISNMKFTDCGGDLKWSQYFYNSVKCKLLFSDSRDTNCLLLDALKDLRSVCTQFSILATFSENVTINQMSFQHTTGSCIAAIGTKEFQFSHSFIHGRCVLIALDNPVNFISNSTHQSWQTYNLTDIIVWPGHKQIATKIDIFFNHNKEFVSISLSNITLKHGNLTLIHKNKYCDDAFKTEFLASNLTVIGNNDTCYAMVLDKSLLGAYCLTTGSLYKNNTIVIKQSHFIQSSIALNRKCLIYGDEVFLRSLFSQPVADTFPYFITLDEVNIENVPCNCLSALSVGCSVLQMRSFNLTNSCCSGESLAFFYSVNVEITGSNNLFQNQRTCISLSQGSRMHIKGNMTFSDNIAQEFNGATFAINKNSTLFIDMGYKVVDKEVLFMNNTGSRCGGILARDHSKIITERWASLKFISNQGYDGGALALYERSTFKYYPMPDTTIEFI